ncbi:hypothetical protein D1007_28037 [Hordeum vulgare]|uniref:Uncharacterized protein n=1 Tax=Hordeum vulgare subsp. vulgare TaxID=112509 RepID=M0YDP7_HORVV|nr:uncharacterized protein LOC123399567 [Hordeum vulgare subsp. vulgare]XP_044949904.1 uncharacterized protein LOC123399567 [Hordeum vulgare subsp. vulgare]KAE8796909.1 hypothetical protein D1007_28037 [Hordeum vulgare]
MAAELMNRSRGMAEGAVVMVCPVLLALALDKVDLKVYGRPALFAMLAMAGITLISGICPLLVCCFSKRFPGMGNINPAPVTASLATLSSSCLLILACFIGQLVVSRQVLIAVGVLCGAFVLVRTVIYYLGGDGKPYSVGLHKVLDESHEFLTGVTGILFLGLEGLALEGHENQMVQKAGPVGTISFIVCALGVCMMYLEMTPPLHFEDLGEIVCLTLTLDSIMAGGTFTLLMVVMFKLMGPPALVLFAPPVLIIVELVYRISDDGTTLPTTHTTGGVIEASIPASLDRTRVTFAVNGRPIPIHAPGVGQAGQASTLTPASLEPTRVAFAVDGRPIPILAPGVGQAGQASTLTPASLELTRVTFTGFLAVSITAIRNTSPSMLTSCFLLFAASAIVFGLSWRLLSQTQIRNRLADLALPDLVDSSADLASLCTHFCIVIATILFLAMAGTGRGK